MSERSGRIAERVHATHDPLTGLPNRVLLGELAGACEVVASKLRRAFDAPFALPTGPRRVSVSVGAALIDGSRAFEDALRDADMAMYADKHAG